MPRMTSDLLLRCTGHARRKRDETAEQFLRRITHLYCSEKGIDKIEGLSKCSNLTVLYLYDNMLSRIENLSSCLSLTHLYLQNNHISHLANISSLRRLTKLYLSGNAITVVEGLEELQNLTELHIANQRLPEGEKLLFDPRSMLSISESLLVLNVSGNGLDAIDDLVCLRELEHLAACNNELSSMKGLGQVLVHLSKLTKLELTGNPVCQKHKYRDRIITMGDSICMVDGREIGDTERQFLINWKAIRKARRKHQRRAVEYNQCELRDSNQAISKAKQIIYRAPPPLTIPALPPRQLSRRIKQQPKFSLQLKTNIQQQQEIVEHSSSLKLPEIVSPYTMGSQSIRKSIVGGLSPIEKPQQTQLRSIHV